MAYICIAEKGNRLPRIKHDTVTEAKRLHNIGCGDVMVASLCAVVTSKDVPVTRKDVVVTYESEDDIPF